MSMGELAARLADIGDHFWAPEQPWIIGGGLLLWLLLLRTLPEGSRQALRQTAAFFVICLLGELAAALMAGLGWDRVADGFREAALIGLGIALIRATGLLVFRVLMPRLRLEAPRILEDVTVIAGYFIFGLVRLRYAGLDLSHIVATSAIITAVIAFAMQDTLGNILGGLAIHLDHSVEIGDWVVVDNVSGQVVDIRWRYTKIATRNGEKVVVPNSVLMKNKFSVVGVYGGRNNAWRRWVWFNVPLEHPPARVVAIVGQGVADAEIPNVAREPAPGCVLMEFGAGFGRYAVRYWLTDPQQDDPTDSLVRLHVFAALERAGMRLAIPEEARHLIKENEARAQALAARELQHREAILARVELLRSLTAEERRTLAGCLTHAPFARGDVIARQGAAADWLYILVAGEAEVWFEQEGSRRLLSRLGPGSVFGEMGLMTGEPRRATVVAGSDVDCYRLDKTGLETVLHGRPVLAEEMARVLAVREAELDRVRQDVDAAARTRQGTDRHASILERMRAFLRL